MSQPLHRYPLLAVIGLLSLALRDTSASESSSNPNTVPDITTFAFRGQSNANPSSNPSENEAMNDLSRSAEEASVFSSALLYEGGCVVSAEAIMCVGGEGYYGFGMIDHYDDEEDDESDDDEDDDDNDGHSSMLSNASLRRSKVGAGGFHRQKPPSQSDNNLQPKNDLVAIAASESRNHLRQAPVAFISAVTKEGYPRTFGRFGILIR